MARPQRVEADDRLFPGAARRQRQAGSGNHSRGAVVVEVRPELGALDNNSSRPSRQTADLEGADVPVGYTPMGHRADAS